MDKVFKQNFSERVLPVTLTFALSAKKGGRDKPDYA